MRQKSMYSLLAEANQQLRNDLDIASFFALRTNATFERNALIFRQALEAIGLDVLEVGEQVRAACVRSDEAEAFGVVEPFDDASLSSAHVIFPSVLKVHRQHCLEGT